jgi:hypothetical protein
MRVEMAIDSDFVAPAMAKALGDEIKAAKAWLLGHTAALAPQALDRDMIPIVLEQGPLGSGGARLMIEDAPRGDVQEHEKVMIRCSLSDDLIDLDIH